MSRALTCVDVAGDNAMEKDKIRLRPILLGSNEYWTYQYSEMDY